ncbi:MAG: hypothetical protein NXI24_24710 [bacterium]|nr:hypothetical protein [bacterium]
MPYFEYIEFDWLLLLLAAGSLLAIVPLAFVLRRSRLALLLLAEMLLLPWIVLIAIGASLHWPLDDYIPEPEISPAPRLTVSLRPLLLFQNQSAWLKLQLPPEIESRRQMPGGRKLDCGLWMDEGGFRVMQPILDPANPQIEWQIDNRSAGRGPGRLVCSSRGKPDFMLRGVESAFEFEFQFLPVWLFYFAYGFPPAVIAVSLWLVCGRLRRTAHFESRREYRKKREREDAGANAKSAEGES